MILPDHDADGAKYRDAVAGILATLDPPATVRVLELDDLPEHGDLIDWLNQWDAMEPDDLRGSRNPTPRPTDATSGE